MGSSVIIAIKHDRQRTFSYSFAQKISRGMYISDKLPKLFDGSNPFGIEVKHSRRGTLYEEGILVSHYIDNEYSFKLFANHDMMFDATALGDGKDKIIASEKDLIRSITNQVKKSQYPFRSHMKGGRVSLDVQAPSPVLASNSPMSIFCIQTDNYATDKFHDHIKNMLIFVETGVLVPHTFGHMQLSTDNNAIIQSGGHVEYIGTLDAQTAALLSLKYGSIEMTRIPNRKIELLSSNELSAISGCSMSVATSFMKSLGLGFSPAKKHDLDNQP
jgi:hypothetical protein